MRRLGLALLALALSGTAAGHSSEFLLAKVVIGAGADVRLEVTADYGQNPLIASREEAAAILPGALQLRREKEDLNLASVRRHTLEDRTELDATAPLTPELLAAAQPHQLVAALWQWRPERNETSLRFSVPRESKHDVLLWVVDVRQPDAEPRWVMLLGGDVSPEIKLPPRAMNKWFVVAAAAAVAAVVLGAGRRWRAYSSRAAVGSSPRSQ